MELSHLILDSYVCWRRKQTSAVVNISQAFLAVTSACFNNSVRGGGTFSESYTEYFLIKVHFLKVEKNL